jgi:hypothetical protein
MTTRNEAVFKGCLGDFVSSMLGAMARSFEARLAALKGDAKPADVHDALGSTSGLLVAAAAKLAEAHGLVDELAPAFVRLLDQPVKRDPGCRGKLAIARTLHDLERWEDDVFARGAGYVQREPAFGGTIDTAAELRGVCGIAHAHFRTGDALDVLAQLLADPERTARLGAAQGIGDCGRPDASALLMFKVLTGDDEPEVLAACYESLFAIAGERALAFVGQRAAAGNEDAALALGASRLPAAYPILARWCEAAADGVRRRIGYLALALLRYELATARLLEIIRDDDPADAIAAAGALATFKDTLRDDIADAASKRDARTRAAIADLIS